MKQEVTVVIPVYNEELFLRQALESVVEQVDCVIIGDNASTDGTEMICREFVEKYDHIQYIRHESNIGNLRNFNHCFALVQTEFFFTMGGHDLVAPNFVEVAKRCLVSSEPDVAGVITTQRWIDNDGNTILVKNTVDDADFNQFVLALSDSDPFHRAYSYANYFYLGLFFTMFRSSMALQYFSNFPPFYLSDGVVIFNILLNGKIIYDKGTEFLWRDNHRCMENQYYRTQKYRDEAMKRYLGHSAEFDLVPAVQLILESFRNKECGDSYRKHKKKLYFKLVQNFYDKFKVLPGDFGTNLRVFLLRYWLKISRFLKKLRKAQKLIFFGLKCTIIPGYMEKKNLQIFQNSLSEFFSKEFSDKDWYHKRHQRCIEQMQKDDIDLLMIGDSITHFWEYTGKKSWDRYCGYYKAINLGFSGDTIEQVLWRLEHLPLEMIQPKLAICLIGTNDVLQNCGMPKEIAIRILNVMSRLRDSFPEMTIVVLKILPLGEGGEDGKCRKDVDEVNSCLGNVLEKENTHKNVILLDISKKFLTRDNKIKKKLMPDLIHPSEEGYDVLGKALNEVIKKILD